MPNLERESIIIREGESQGRTQIEEVAYQIISFLQHQMPVLWES